MATSGFYVSVGNLNSGPHAYIPSALNHWPSLQPSMYFLHDLQAEWPNSQPQSMHHCIISKCLLQMHRQTDIWTDVTGNAGSRGKSREQVPIWHHLAHLALICDVVPSYFMVLFCKVTQKSHNLPRREQGEESFYSSHDIKRHKTLCWLALLGLRAGTQGGGRTHLLHKPAGEKRGLGDGLAGKELHCKHEDPSSIPSHVKKPSAVGQT